jgi:hypothetical protein
MYTSQFNVNDIAEFCPDRSHPEITHICYVLEVKPLKSFAMTFTYATDTEDEQWQHMGEKITGFMYKITYDDIIKSVDEIYLRAPEQK